MQDASNELRTALNKLFVAFPLSNHSDAARAERKQQYQLYHERLRELPRTVRISRMTRTATQPTWQLHAGNALAWLMGLPDASADAFIFDPPYASGGRSATERKRSPSSKYLSPSARSYPDFEGDQRDQRGWLRWMTLIIGEAYRVAHPGTPLCMFADWRQAPTAADALQAGGFIWRGTLPWDKTGAARPTLGRFRQQAEFIIWGSKGALDRERRVLSDSNVHPGVFRHRVDPDDKHHTTGKPTALMRDIVRICEPGGVIVDPFAGSGTTGVAALQLGYRFLGCELTPEYADIARQRLAEAVAISAGSQANSGQLSLGSFKP